MRREPVPDSLAVRAAPFALLSNTRKTERGANQFLTPLAVRAAPFALLSNTRKTECGANQFLTPLAVRAAPFALLNDWTKADFRGDVDVFGTRSTRGALLVNLVLAGHAAYQTQLFCYLKACGRDELNTMNLWAGVDGPA